MVVTSNNKDSLAGGSGQQAQPDSRRYAAGLDLGGTFLKFTIVDDSGRVPFHGKVPSNADRGPEAITAQIIEAVRQCKEYAGQNCITLEGVGIGTPGIISADGRTVLGGAENLKGWAAIPLAEIVEQAEGLKTLLNNDANLMALAETMFGAAKGCTDVVFLTVGTGIGGGILIDGQLYGGYRNRGTELGHITVRYDGERCACGNTGCLEHYASTAALVRRFRDRCQQAGIVRDGVDGEKIVKLYLEGDSYANKAMEEHWQILGQGVASFINIFSPQKIVIGGGISEAGAFYISKIRDYALAHALRESAEGIEFVAATLGNRSGCLGAAGLIFAAKKR